MPILYITTSHPVDRTGSVTMRLSSIVEHLQVPEDELLPHNIERLMDDHEAQLEDADSRTTLWVSHVRGNKSRQ